ncbi:MAG: type II CAAX prenyl endopeptidase Rce1 family protein, partial [Candidatus Hodarchaeota archaeon]
FLWVLSPLFVELLYRRTVIPLLEDRGLSPLIAVVITASGYVFIDIPYFMLNPDLPIAYISVSTLIFGLGAGFIYILTRNVFYSVFFSALFNSHSYLHTLGIAYNSDNLLTIYDVVNLITFLISIIILIYIDWRLINRDLTSKTAKVLTLPSSSNITKGIIGFFVISASLLIIQGIVVKFGRCATNNIFPEYFSYIFVFYIIAFSIPYWLTITTEYALD